MEKGYFTFTSFSHGTRCAGEVAGRRDNGICGVGVAYDSQVSDLRMSSNLFTLYVKVKCDSSRQRTIKFPVYLRGLKLDFSVFGFLVELETKITTF